MPVQPSDRQDETGAWDGVVGHEITPTYDLVGSATPYGTWATGGVLFDGDANGDGVTGGLAFQLGAATPGENAFSKSDSHPAILHDPECRLDDREFGTGGANWFA